MIKVEWFYWLIAAFFLVVAVLVGRDGSNPRRLWSGAFWGLLGAAFAYSTFVNNGAAPAWVLGLAVMAIAAIAGFGLLKQGSEERTTDGEEHGRLADRWGNRLFLPVLVIPVVTAVFAVLLKKVHVGGQPLLEAESETIIGLGVASVIAVGVAMWLLHEHRAVVPLHEGRRLLENIGWAATLPQLLAMLGLVFATAGVGDAIGDVADNVLPRGSLLAAVALYCIGMAVFTVIMGNAFAAFPVLTAAVGFPLLIQHFGGNAPAVFAIGMLAGYCGTLCTPMAANFNIVPVALLDLKSDYAVIRAQVPTAVPLLACNVAIMYLFAF
jgi:uncharacterized membrane protein